jgi:predicted transposase/invertase (TIGR01784 family)
VKVYNVNDDQNKEFAQRSQMLAGYVTFIGKCKEKMKAGMKVEDAVPEAVRECIHGNILVEYLKDHASEVVNMLVAEWDNETAMRISREEGIAEGEARGEAKKQREFAHKLLKRGTPIEQIIEDTGLSLADIIALREQMA